MRKNNMLNKQVIKAMSIAISAGMLLQPMQALAESAPEENNDGKNISTQEATHSSESFNTAKAAAANADYDVEKATDSAEAVATAVLPDGDDDPNKAIKDQADQDVKDAATALNTVLTNDGQKLNDDCDDDVKGVDNASVVSASDNVKIMDDQDSIIAGSLNAGNQKAAEANAADLEQQGLQTDAETLASNTTKAVSNAKSIVDQQSDLLQNATNEGEAVDIYNTAATAVSSADSAVTAAEQKFTVIEKKFNTAETNYNNAKQAAADAQQALDTARTNFNNAKQAAIDLTGGNDDDKLDGHAETTLAELEKKVSNLNAAAQAAYDEYKETGYAKIIAQQELLKNAEGTLKWGEQKTLDMYRDLCADIIMFYYLPGEGATDINYLGWNTEKGDYFYEDGTKSTKGDVLNHGVFTYKDKEGNTQTLLVNYKTLNGNNANGRQIVIFEKTEHTVILSADKKSVDIDDSVFAEVDENGFAEYKGMIIVKNANGEYEGYTESDGGKTVVSVDDDATDDNKTVSIDEDSKQISYVVEDGKLVKKVTADVTTTTYTENNLAVAEATLASETAAKEQYVAAMKAKVGALKDGEVLKVYVSENQIVTYTKADLTKENVDWEAGFKVTTDEKTTPVPTVTGYTVNGTYQKQFTKTVNISGTVSGTKHFPPSASDARDAFRDRRDDVLDDYTFDNTILDFDDYQTDRNLISHTSDVTVGDVYKGGIANLGRYIDYTGSVTVTYNEVKSVVLDKSIILSWFGVDYIDFDNAEEVFASKGMKVICKDAWDWNIGAGTVYYIPAEQTTFTYNGTDVEAAKQAFLAEYAGQGAMVTGTTEIVENVNQVITKYGYEGVKALVELAKTENVVISTETWAKALGAATTEYRNDNWYTGDVIVAENIDGFGKGVDYKTDGKVKDANGKAITNVSLNEEQEAKTVAFNDTLANAAAIGQMYLDTMDKADTALNNIQAAKADVADLTAKLKALKANAGSIDEINELSADLSKARAELNAAIRARADLRNQLQRLDEELQRKLEEFRPVENPENNEQPAGPAAPAPAIRTVANAPAPAAAPEVEIEEENAPLAENPGEVEIVEEEAPKAPEVTVTEEATPTSPVPETETEKPSWLWLVIILALGTTGAELYRRHLLKQKALKAEAEQNNINK